MDGQINAILQKEYGKHLISISPTQLYKITHGH